MQYGVSGLTGPSSFIGRVSGSPYTEALEAKTTRRTPCSAAAANTLLLPTMLMSTLSYGSAWLLLIETAARWITSSQPRMAWATAPPYRTSWSMSSTSPVATHSATFSRSPRNMLSKTRTLCPRSSSSGTTWEPMKPAPPVRKTVEGMGEVLLRGLWTMGGGGSASRRDDLADRGGHALDLGLGQVGVHRDGEVPAEDVRGDRARLGGAVDRLQVRGVGAEVALDTPGTQLGRNRAAVDGGVEREDVALPGVRPVRRRVRQG